MPQTLPPIDDDVFEALQQLAVPLVDDVNSVLRRLLGLDSDERARTHAVAPELARIEAPGASSEVRSTARSPEAQKAPRQGKQRARARAAKKSGKRTRAPRGSLLAEAEYELPILQVLADAGGRAPSSEVIAAVGARLDHHLTPMDREVLDSGDVRWKNRAQFVRLKLIREGDMARESPRGVWEITEQGQARLAKAAA